jgi:hypothetical protein
VRAPEKAGDGFAKVTIHIPAGKDLKLLPAAFAVSLDQTSSEIRVAKPWNERR